MAARTEQESNCTQLNIKERGLTPEIWVGLDPNSYENFAPNLTTVRREPISQDRQLSKGGVTDSDPTGGISIDLTQRNTADLMQGFMYADYRRKGEAQNRRGVTTLTFSMTAATSLLTRVGGTLDLTTQFAVGSLVYISGFATTANNGLFAVGAVTATTLQLDDADGSGTNATVVDEAATSDASVVEVGRESAAGDLDVDTTGARPALTSSTLDFTTLSLNVGEHIFIGGDGTDTRFATAANVNNGFARVRSIAANRLEFDKTQRTMASEANSTINIHIYFGRFLKNEADKSLQVTRQYDIERITGTPDDASTNQQAEYLIQAVPNQFVLRADTASKLEHDLNWVAFTYDPRTAADGLLAGTRVDVLEDDLINTSSDISKVKLQLVNETNANPDALFAFLIDATVTVDNGVTLNKALGELGGVGANKGFFAVSGEMNVYFADETATKSITTSADVTLDIHFVSDNAGISYDWPVITLSTEGKEVTPNEPVRLPIDMEMSKGSKIDTAMNHTMSIIYWDYLPDLAD